MLLIKNKIDTFKDKLGYDLIEIHRHGSSVDLKINLNSISFKSYTDFDLFGYHLLRQSILSTLSPQNKAKLDLTSLNDFVVLDSGMNVIGSTDDKEKINKLPSKRKKASKKSFWGTILTDSTLQIQVGNDKHVLEYTERKTLKNTTEVLVMKDNDTLEDAKVVYVDTELTANKCAEAFYVYENTKDGLTFNRVISDNWLF